MRTYKTSLLQREAVVSIVKLRPRAHRKMCPFLYGLRLAKVNQNDPFWVCLVMCTWLAYIHHCCYVQVTLSLYSLLLFITTNIYFSKAVLSHLVFACAICACVSILIIILYSFIFHKINIMYMYAIIVNFEITLNICKPTCILSQCNVFVQCTKLVTRKFLHNSYCNFLGILQTVCTRS